MEAIRTAEKKQAGREEKSGGFGLNFLLYSVEREVRGISERIIGGGCLCRLGRGGEARLPQGCASAGAPLQARVMAPI